MDSGSAEKQAPDAKAKTLDPNDLQKMQSMIRLIKEGGSPKRGWLDFTINIQLLIVGIIAAVVGIGSWAISEILTYDRFQTKIDAFQVSTQAQLTALSMDNKALTDQLNTMRLGNIQLRDQLAKWQADSAALNAEQQKALANMDKNMAVIQERLNYSHTAPGPKGELPVPERFGLLEGRPIPLAGGTR